MILAAVACALSAAFAVVVGDRYRRSRRPAFAAWTAGLLIFAAAAGFQAAGEAGGFTAVTFRGFYLLGGVLGVIYLALGTLFLLAPRRVAWACAAVLLVVTVLLALDAALVPVDVSTLSSPVGVLGGNNSIHPIPVGSPLYDGALILNILGTVVLVGGSAWSAYRFIRQRAGVDRVLCNVLLTVGALVIAYGFSTAKTLGVSSISVLGAFEAVGIAIMFAGFLALGRVGQPASRPVSVAGALPAEGGRQ